MKKFCFVFALILFFGISSKVFSESWVLVAVNTNGTQFFMDKESLLWGSDTITFKVKAVPAKSKNIKYELSSWVFYVESREYKESSKSIYYQSGETYDMLMNRRRNIETGSVAEQFYNFVSKLTK